MRDSGSVLSEEMSLIMEIEQRLYSFQLSEIQVFKW